jgi:hypothetical protein
MEPREIVRRLAAMLADFSDAHPGVHGPLNPMSALLGGGAQFIVPATSPELAALGVGSVTPWVECLGKLGYVAAVCPVFHEGAPWIGFLPSERFETQLRGSQSRDRLIAAVVDAAVPPDHRSPSRASLAAGELLAELADYPDEDLPTDRRMLQAVLRELSSTSELACCHAMIALSGKLLELAFATLYARWQVEINGRHPSLSDYTGRLRALVNQGDARARELADLGLDGLGDLVRNVRNGAVHARLDNIELPSLEQSEAVVLLTVDMLRRFILPRRRPAPAQQGAAG